MLVFTRDLNDRIVIGGDTVIQILGVKGDRVRLGITAPDDVEINREEVFVAKYPGNKLPPKA